MYAACIFFKPQNKHKFLKIGNEQVKAVPLLILGTLSLNL